MNTNRIILAVMLLVTLLATCSWAGGPNEQGVSSTDFNAAVSSLTSALSSKATTGTSAANQFGPINASGTSRFTRFVSPLVTSTTASATPNVSGGNTFYLDYSSTVGVTNFVGGVEGQVITVLIFARGAGTTVTISRGVFIRCAGAADLVVAPNTYGAMMLMYDGDAWNEICRSNNLL